VKKVRQYRNEPTIEPSIYESVEQQLVPFFDPGCDSPISEPPRKKLKEEEEPNDGTLFSFIDVRDFE